MRTTPREKLVLWINGLALAGGFELLVRSQIDPLSLQGVALIVPIIGALALFTAGMLGGRARNS